MRLPAPSWPHPASPTTATQSPAGFPARRVILPAGPPPSPAEVPPPPAPGAGRGPDPGPDVGQYGGDPAAAAEAEDWGYGDPCLPSPAVSGAPVAEGCSAEYTRPEGAGGGWELDGGGAGPHPWGRPEGSTEPPRYGGHGRTEGPGAGGWAFAGGEAAAFAATPRRDTGGQAWAGDDDGNDGGAPGADGVEVGGGWQASRGDGSGVGGPAGGGTEGAAGGPEPSARRCRRRASCRGFRRSAPAGGGIGCPRRCAGGRGPWPRDCWSRRPPSAPERSAPRAPPRHICPPRHSPLNVPAFTLPSEPMIREFTRTFGQLVRSCPTRTHLFL